MDPSIPRPTGPRRLPSGSPLHRDPTDFEPIPIAAEGPVRSRIGIPRLPFRSRRTIGLLLLGLIVVPWLPISRPPGDATLARRIRGVGDSAILTFAFAPDGATIATIRWDGRVGLRDAGAGAGTEAFLDHPGLAWALAFSPEGRSLVVGGIEPDLFLYRIEEDGGGRPLGMPIRDTSSVAFSPDGGTLAASSHLTPEILLWDLAAGRERARLRGHGSPVISLAFAPDGRSLASGSRGDGTIILWDLATGRPLRRLGVPPGPVIGLAYSPDGRWLGSIGSLDRPVRLWDLEGRQGDRLIGSHSQASESVALSPDARMLATAGDDGAIRLWDLATGTELRRVGEPGDRLTGVAFSPDGRMLAAIGHDADIRLWILTDLFGAGPGPSTGSVEIPAVGPASPDGNATGRR